MKTLLLSIFIHFARCEHGNNYGYGLSRLKEDSTSCNVTELEKYIIPYMTDVMTAIHENSLKITCFFEHRWFPTINGIDTFDEIECTENGWFFPEDMDDVRCKLVSCPQLLDPGNDIDLQYREQQGACEECTGVSYKCSGATYKCKQESLYFKCNNAL